MFLLQGRATLRVKRFTIRKRIPPAIPKLLRSSAGVNRHPSHIGTAFDLWEQTVTLLETIPFRGLTLVISMKILPLFARTAHVFLACSREDSKWDLTNYCGYSIHGGAAAVRAWQSFLGAGIPPSADYEY